MKFVFVAGLALVAGQALAQDIEVTGDPDEGESVFRQCQTCHVVVDASGETLAGRNAKTGPNLYGVVGRHAAQIEDFRYGDSIVEAGEAGLVWNEETMIPYLQNTNDFLRVYLDDSGARSKMTFRIRSEEDAVNVIAYLHSLAEGADGS